MARAARHAFAMGLLLISAFGCALRRQAPATSPSGAEGGRAPPGFDHGLACRGWDEATGSDAEGALSHVSFPELDPRGCFVPVRYGPGGPKADPPPHGCGYPAPSTRAHLLREASRYERLAGPTPGEPLPLALACNLSPEVRRAAARANGRTLRALARRLGSGNVYPYAAASTVGFGHSAQGTSLLVDYRPGDTCPVLSKKQMRLLSVNIHRAHRAAAAQQARVAPVVTVSGGAVHSPLVEAFMLYYLATCRFGVPPDSVLVDPCADHTHTNLRNTGNLLVTLGGRTAYLVTDDGLQSGYFQDWNFFHLFGGSIDQRSLRDFGFLVGSFRQASEGMSAGFWFTPYRFWAEPLDGLGSFTCVR